MSRTAYPTAEAPSVNGPQGTLYRSTRPRPVPPVLRAIVTPPGPRLTALGSGLMAVGAMVLAGLIAQWTTGRAPVFYGVVFLLACLAAAGWVRPNDLIAAPVAMPLAFAAGLLAAADYPGGLGDKLLGVFTELALQAPWLYAGTLLAAIVALVRKAALIAVRQLRRRSGARSGHAGASSQGGERTSAERSNGEQKSPERTSGERSNAERKSPERSNDRRPDQTTGRPATRTPRPPAPRPPHADPGGAPWEARR
jgi:hypothetical protein